METFETETHAKEIDTIYEMSNNTIDDIVFDDADLMYDFKTKFRLIRKAVSSFLRKKKQKNFKEILYITLKNIPSDYILAFQKQYPDKEIKVLQPVDKIKGSEKFRFEFFLQNRMNTAVLYELPLNRDNIKVYGLYSTAFSGQDMTRFQYLAPFIKAARVCAEKLKPDIVHADNIPFFLGAEFERRNNLKVFQTADDFSQIELNKLESFWAAINLVNRQNMKKLCRDKMIKKCIASLFNLHNSKRFYQMRECLEFIYQNYFKFRKYIDKCEDIDENILFNRMNARVIKLFPQMAYGDEVFYNPMFSSIKKADSWGTVSKTYYREIFQRPELSGKMYPRIEKTKSKSSYISFGCTIPKVRLYQPFNSENFRELRLRNKTYILKEFSEERIRTKFTDISLFLSENHAICGYLDSFYNAPLVFAAFTPDIFAQGVDIALNTILKLFEENKNIQVIVNIPDGLKNHYIKSWVEFLNKNSAFKGRWLFIDGEVNKAQFFASSDMTFLPQRMNVTTSDHYVAMKYGCIPIASRSGIYNDTIADIFDDITNGCGFKTKTSLFTNDDGNQIYLSTVLKALNLYTKNPASWNLLIKNAINYDSSWNFERIEKFNEIYENL